jgi:predicted RNA binding protein YcfA (HicA-like mRNA interferase family)
MGAAEQLQVSYPECETQSAAAVVVVAVAGKLGSGRAFCTDDHATTTSVPVHTNRDIKVNSITSSHTNSHKADLTLTIHTNNSVTYLGW